MRAKWELKLAELLIVFIIIVSIDLVWDTTYPIHFRKKYLKNKNPKKWPIFKVFTAEIILAYRLQFSSSSHIHTMAFQPLSTKDGYIIWNNLKSKQKSMINYALFSLSLSLSPHSLTARIHTMGATDERKISKIYIFTDWRVIFLNKFHVFGDDDRRQLPPHNINICLLWSSTWHTQYLHSPSIYDVYCRSKKKSECEMGKCLESWRLILTMRDRIATLRSLYTQKGIHPYGLSCTKLKIQYIIMLTIFLPSS